MSVLRTLNQQVTVAILKAERLESACDAEAAREAFAEVAGLEHGIATETDHTSVEGVAARLGAVRAALKAGYRLKAKRLAFGYISVDGGVSLEMYTALIDAFATVRPACAPASEEESA